jgi:hypothetical protein
MKFMCIAYEEQKKLDDLSPAEWQALRTETLSYVESLHDSGRLIAAHPLRSAKTASTVRVRNGKLSVTDGPFAETKEQIGGFFLIEARDADEAIQIAANWPSARIGIIEVRPLEDGLQIGRRYSA